LLVYFCEGGFGVRRTLAPINARRHQVVPGRLDASVVTEPGFSGSLKSAAERASNRN
jgi:hypothetical protein